MSMRETPRGLQRDPDGDTERPYARLTDDDRRLIRLLIVALAAFCAATVVGIVIVTVDLLARDAEREETVAALVLAEERRLQSEERRRTNFELLTGYIECVALQSQSRRGDPRDCPDPSFVPPPEEVELVPEDLEEDEGPSVDGPP